MNDTIVALATPPGISGIAVIRLSGPEAIEITNKLFSGKTKISEALSHTIHYGKFIADDVVIDSVTISVFKKPNSYTGEDVIELSCHGGILIVDEIISVLIKNGARHAQAGEFTRRAFLNGKMDLTQVEAVADIIHSHSKIGFQTSARQIFGSFKKYISVIRQNLLDISSLLELELDFADEDIDLIDRTSIYNKLEETISNCTKLKDSYKASEIARSGYFIGIAGHPNSGKSTLFNALLEKERAIVSHIPGTTRDYLEETLFFDGITVKITDTAGIRETDDVVEIQGIRMIDSVLKQSNLIIVLNDISSDKEESNELFRQLKEKYPESDIVVVNNKIDLLSEEEYNKSDNQFYISAKRGNGIAKLKDFIRERAIKSVAAVNDILLNKRQSLLLEQAITILTQIRDNIFRIKENELISIDIHRTADILGEITGEKWNEAVLNNMFSNFCIGK